MHELLEPLGLLIRDAPWLVWLGIVLFGGCIGSFMNVVVYRLPAGQSLLHPGSRCPWCEHPIRWRDNLPVLSWLRLRGRCRDCQAPISSRYPLVELFTMVLFANQWWNDVQGRAGSDDLAAAVFAFAWHVSVLTVLVCAALIDFDGHTTPRPLVIFGVAVPLGLTLLSPRAAARVLELDEISRVWETLLVGAILALLTTLLLKFRPVRRQPGESATTDSHFWTPLALAGMTGLYLGPQRAIVTLLLTTLLWRLVRLLRFPSRRGAPWSWYLAALTGLAVAFPT